MSYDTDTESDREQSYDFPVIGHSTVLVKLPNGEIRTETGSDGTWLMFDAPCLECLPYCKAHCCSCTGILVTDDEVEEYADTSVKLTFNYELNSCEMTKSSDGFCHALDRQTRTCSIYEDRPHTCKTFHCTRGFLQRGWKLSNLPNRLSTK